MSMATKIRILLLEKNLKIKDLAALMGCSSSNLSNKLKQDNFSERDLRKIADVLDCDYYAAFLPRQGGVNRCGSGKATPPPENDGKGISFRLKQARKAKGYTQESLAQAMGVSRGVITNIEFAKVEPRQLVLRDICEILQIREEWLWSGKGPMEAGAEPAPEASGDSFPDRLRKLRKGKNLTQKQLAALCDTTERVIQNYELGERKPSFEAILSLCKGLDISADELLGLTNPFD